MLNERERVKQVPLANNTPFGVACLMHLEKDWRSPGFPACLCLLSQALENQQPDDLDELEAMVSWLDYQSPVKAQDWLLNGADENSELLDPAQLEVATQEEAEIAMLHLLRAQMLEHG